MSISKLERLFVHDEESGQGSIPVIYLLSSMAAFLNLSSLLLWYWSTLIWADVRNSVVADESSACWLKRHCLSYVQFLTMPHLSKRLLYICSLEFISTDEDIGLRLYLRNVEVMYLLHEYYHITKRHFLVVFFKWLLFEHPTQAGCK